MVGTHVGLRSFPSFVSGAESSGGALASVLGAAEPEVPVVIERVVSPGRSISDQAVVPAQKYWTVNLALK